MYNEKGQLTEIELNNGYRVTYLYDVFGNKIKKSVFDERGIWKVFKYEYDRKHNCISEALYYVPGSADDHHLENAYAIKWIYNDLNLVIEEQRNSNTTKYVYNNDGKLVESLAIRKEDWNKEFRITSKFNSDKQIIESKEYDLHKGKVTEIIMFDYDERKNLRHVFPLNMY